MTVQAQLSPPPPSFRSTPPNDYRCSLHFSQSHRSVSLMRIPILPPSPLRFLLIKTLSTLKCSTISSRILFVRSSCLPPPPPSSATFLWHVRQKVFFYLQLLSFAHMNSCKIKLYTGDVLNCVRQMVDTPAFIILFSVYSQVKSPLFI